MNLLITHLTSEMEGTKGGYYRRMDFAGMNEFGETKKYFTYIDESNKNYIKKGWDQIAEMYDNMPLINLVVSMPNFKFKNKAKGMISADCEVRLHKELTAEINADILKQVENA